MQKQKRYTFGRDTVYFISAGYDEATDTTQENDCYVIASRGTWLPGSFATLEAARLGLAHDVELLASLNKKINGELGREITDVDIVSAWVDREIINDIRKLAKPSTDYI